MKPWNQHKPPANTTLTLSAVPLGAELKTLDDLFFHAEKHADLAMKKDGRAMPTLFVIGNEGPHILTLANASADEAAKDDFTVMARLLAVAHAATATVMVAEAWVTIAKPGGAVDTSIPPSQSPDRRELVVLLGEERSGPRQKFLPIIRNDAGEFLRFGEFEVPRIDAVAGRFAQFLSPVAPSSQEQAIAKTLLRLRGLDAEPRQAVSRAPGFRV